MTREEEYKIINNNIFCKLYGWLNPNGEFVKCETAKHIEKARELLKKENINVRNPERELENRGYIKLCGSGIIFAKMLEENTFRCSPTKEQQDWIFDNRLKLTPIQYHTWGDIIRVIISY